MIGLVLLPAAGAAQSVVEHHSVYSAAPPDPTTRPRARSAMPLISTMTLPPAMLLRSQTMLTAVGGSGAAAGGSGPGSASGGQTGQAPAPMTAQAFGTASEMAIAPYSTSRASADKLGTAPTVAAQVGVTSYPWRATGKLYFKSAGADYACSAALIKPGLLLTAAHCVTEYGKKSAGWHSDFVFAPAHYDAGQPPPYGTWTALSELVPGPYVNGTDTCVTKGVVCNNDIAIITLAANSAKKLPGTVVGWFGYGWGGYSAVASFGGAQLSAITQLGYPVAFDSGEMLERNDGVGGFWTTGSLKNTVLGSAFTGGSSGGPWLVNFGASPTLDTTEASLGSSSTPNVVVGVTSWGYTTKGANSQGSSWFGVNKQYPGTHYIDNHKVDRGAGNIGSLVMFACNAHYDHC